MRKNLNTMHIEGYVYDTSKLKKKVSGERSKNPGTEFFTGDLSIAVDEEGLNVIPVHFSYVTAVYAKSGKTNNTFTALQTILDNAETKTWLSGGKDQALKVKIDGNLSLNDFISPDNGQRVSARRCEGSFVTIVNALCDEVDRHTFQTDIVINRINHIDADPEKHIDEDYTSLSGYIFNYRNELLPVDMSVRTAGGMKYFENLDVSGKDPLYTKVWGKLNSRTIKTERVEESAFGEASVTVNEHTAREWTVTGTAKVPYEFGDEEVLTENDIIVGVQNREVMWAEVQKRNDEYQASKSTTPIAPKASAPAVKAGGFTF